MSACSFVKHAVNDPNPLSTAEARNNAKDDVEVISNALHFVHDLLRNMLDIHRAANKDLVVHLKPTDLLRDVLEPVAAMLHQRRSRIQFLMECPENLHVNTDHLRLKQIVLNLSRNSSKFVDEGFIRLRATVVEGLVELSVEDSGPGIPLNKRTRLFSKFQESLDTLSQGTVRSTCAVGVFVHVRCGGRMRLNLTRLLARLDRASGCTCARISRSSWAGSLCWTRSTTAALRGTPGRGSSSR
jgi:K+-sensing histidine kinase KdpD